MGYSCTAAAAYTLDAIGNLIGSQSSNGMPDGGFWEQGRENQDGAITGTVWKPYDETRVTKRGSFRIEPDGKVSRFPGLPRKLLGQAEKTSQARYHENHVAERNWRLDALRLADFLRDVGHAEHCWPEFEQIAQAYQQEAKIMFLALPGVDAPAMADFLTDITNN